MMESMYYILFMIEMLLFILICYFMFVEESSTKPPRLTDEHLGNYRIAVPLIAVNLILLVLSAFGGYRIDYFLLQNVTTTPVYTMTSTPIVDFAVWAFVFFMLFLVHILLLFKNYFDYMREVTYDPNDYHNR